MYVFICRYFHLTLMMMRMMIIFAAASRNHHIHVMYFHYIVVVLVVLLHHCPSSWLDNDYQLSTTLVITSFTDSLFSKCCCCRWDCLAINQCNFKVSNSKWLLQILIVSFPLFTGQNRRFDIPKNMLLSLFALPLLYITFGIGICVFEL